MPQENITDQDTQFNSHLIQSITKKFKKHMMFTRCQQKADGQIKATNKVLEDILKKTIQQHHKD